MKNYKRAIVAAGLVAFSSSSVAGMANLLDFHPFPDHYTYLGVEGSYYDIQKGDNKAGDVHNYWQPAVNAGYRWSPLLSLQAQYGRVRTHAPHLPGSVRAERMSLAVRGHMANTEILTFQPYAGLGYNRNKLTPTADGVDTERRNMVFGEVGLQRMITKHFFLDIGYRHLISTGGAHFVDHQPYAALNFITTGANNVELAKAEPEPVNDYPRIDDKPTPKCFNVPAGAKVDADGCPIKLEKPIKVTLHINFPFDQSEVPSKYRPDVKQISDSLTAYPGSNVSLVGHTDNIGSQRYNQKLSEQRANAVRNMLVTDFDIDYNRISTSGRSFDDPVASNDTKAGRAENRRVESTVSGNQEVYKAVNGSFIPVNH